ncbi:hypothetical protein [Halomonas cupida]|uniref:Uncharacterized protein n=1 Tax=Halomonas cupida TaxID=44933 RepID=A0A1M6ZFL7_9GAMM|nr:hypothetical protein [Halomonas cupida]GEN24384.1 hypothetical protein HCU01_23330 [Halomonas cupida]SHL29296.1 hypothetical protein SAMN05660971_00095 [Halomonas cupida]
MSISAIVVMVASIIALWGVASLALVYSMRQEDRKLMLLKEQGDFEPFSPAAQRDIEDWLRRHPDGPEADEMRELLEWQHRSLTQNARRFHRWPDA